MTREEKVQIDQIVQSNCEEVLKKYFTKDIVRRIATEIRSGVEYDVANLDDEKGGVSIWKGIDRRSLQTCSG